MSYFVELAIIHSTLIAAYYLLLRQERQYSRLRFFLISAALLALVIPVLRLPAFWQLFKTPSLPDAAQTYLLAPVTVAGAEANSFDYTQLFIGAYWVIVGMLVFRILYHLVRLVLLRLKSHPVRVNGHLVYQTREITGSFTFFHWVFIDPNITETDDAYELILQHERAHAQLGHTYDILLFECLRAFCWWLPSAWFARQEIKKIHEYQADAYALKSFSADRYSNVLISATLKSHGMSMASSFHDGLILKRLKAMKLQMKTIKPWKLSTLAVLTAALVITFACNEELDAEIKDMGSNSNMISYDQLPAAMQKDVAALQDDLVFLKVTIEHAENEPMKARIDRIAELQQIDPEAIHAMNVQKTGTESGYIYIAFAKDGKNLDYIAQKSKTADEVFTVVEEQPEFPGGMTAYAEYLAKSMTYPAAAKEKGLEGKVYVQFVVMPDGTLSDVKTIKGVAPSLDAEAVRIVANSPKFIPGKQRGKAVKVRMVLPIVFALGEAQNSPDDAAAPLPEKPDMKVDAQQADGKWVGTVYGEDNQPLAGVNIIEQGTSNGTVSDRDGSFSLAVSKNTSPIVLSHVSYHTSRVLASTEQQ